MKYNHVNYLWDDQKADTIKDDEIALFLYRSNILGADLRITNFGGGNTSVKTMEKDPLTGESVEVMWVKGSGGDIGTLTRKGIAGLYTSRLRALKRRYRGLAYEDEMVALFQHCLFDLDSAAPSIDTPLHGLLPYKHIDHLHPDALIAVAAAQNSDKITHDIWGDSMGWVPWQRPGFDLGLQLEKCVQENPNLRGIVLGGHGVFTWADTSKACYLNSLEVIEQASAYIAEKQLGKMVFGGLKLESLDPASRFEQAASLAPILRGLCSQKQRMIGHFTDDERVLEYVNSQDLAKLAPLGTSCPDHFLRTKIQPLVLSLSPDENLADANAVRQKIQPLFEQYRAEYTAYYEQCKHPDSPAMRDPNPVVILYPGVGMFTFAKDKQTARVAAEFYLNAINVMRGAEALSSYIALPRQEAFNIEYWLLEEAKLQRMPKEKPLSRRIALISGSGGGIGKAIADKLAAEGACVVLSDIVEERVKDAASTFKKDVASYTLGDISSESAVQNMFKKACVDFGGVDIMVHSAGLAISKPLEETSLEDWDLLQNVLVKGQFLLAKSAAEVMRKQNFGGDLISIASKNGLFAGPNNAGYGTAKAAQQHMARLLSAELAKDQIKVNIVNPDGVIVGSKIWEGAWAEGRAKAYGITVEELPAYYAKRNMLNKIILPDDIANAVFAFVAILDKCTGNTLNVDGGIAAAFVR